MLAQPDYPAWGFAEVFVGAALYVPSVILGSTLVTMVSQLLHLGLSKGILSVLGEVIGYGILFAVLFFIFALNHEKPLLQSLGWVKPGLEVPALITTGLLLALFVLIFEALLLRNPNPDTAFQKLLSDRATRFALAIFGVSLGPIAEELLFRGFLQPVLMRVTGVLPGIILTAALFGAMHLGQYGNQWQAGLGIMVVGLVLGVVQHLTGSTKASSIVHISYNSVLFLLMLAGGEAAKK